MLKVSVITVCFNAAQTIKDTINSVLLQTYKNIEYIIIDGASKDATVSIVQSYGNKITKFVSEKDKGIYDAMNKGINLATGDIVAILNSDDFYASNTILTDIVKVFVDNKVDAVYGDLDYVDQKDINKIVRRWRSSDFNPQAFKRGWAPPHPAFFVRREVYAKYGLFYDDFKIAADYEFMLRILYRYQLSAKHISKVLVMMRAGGVTNSNLSLTLLTQKEFYKAWKINNLKPNIFTLFTAKIFTKLKQLIIK